MKGLIGKIKEISLSNLEGFDAVAIKLYNGAPRHFLSYIFRSNEADYPNGRWFTNPFYKGRNYVSIICQEYREDFLNEDNEE